MTSITIKESAQQRARDLVARIERDINIGRFGAGAWLKQVELEETYGCSRLSVRQALERLAERGLVELIPQRGARVMEFNARKLQNIIEMRALLEVGAVEKVCGRIDAAGFERLTELARHFQDRVQSGTAQEQEESNREFHREMLRHCPNSDLNTMIFDLRDRIPVSVRREHNTALTLARTAAEHFEIIDCLRRQDLDALRIAMRRHVIGAYQMDADA
ncbi:GntR family transcriptional regulator [Acerihabitans arboris]|uniref:FCD domain-containing protein n=1 Tax=Acerihabitans arboris TaxID=2691583 RepID=A0A845SLR1_9GAMM|nr:GntR family transcriptional regulator [Acerihabitans arboris]NDL63926.1 FCD domain-containing protein [Acerihabitans arboris]